MIQAVHKPCIQLFCIPHAAGSATMYSDWKQDLPANIQMVPLELAGRGRRFNDELYSDFQAALDDLYKELCLQRSDQPYAILGHSLGSLFAYELAMLAQQEEEPPVMLFLTGQKPPHHFGNSPRFFGMSDDELWDILIAGSQTPWDEHEHGEQIRDMYLPILRADLSLCDSYRHKKGRSKYRSPVVIMNGASDLGVQAEPQEWYELIDAPCHNITFPGGHYFIYEDHDRVINTVVYYLKGII